MLKYEEIQEICEEKGHAYMSEIDIYEQNENGDFDGEPYVYTLTSNSKSRVKMCMDVLFEAVEIEGLDNRDILVNITVFKNGRYVESDEAIFQTQIKRTDEPSKFIAWGHKKPHIFSIDKNRSKITLVDFEKENEEMIVYKKCKMMIRTADMKIGDQIEIPLRDLGTFTATVHDVTNNGILFIFDDCVTRHCMNSDGTAKGGYEKSELCKWINEELLEQFPMNLKSRIHDLTIPTYGQIFGHDDWYNQAITSDNDEQLSLMKIRKNRICTYENDTCWYWLRNTTKSGDCFARVYIIGDAVCSYAYCGNGVRPAFLLS